jgi:hypothetical protein
MGQQAAVFATQPDRSKPVFAATYELSTYGTADPMKKHNQLESLATGKNSRTRFWPKPPQPLANQRFSGAIPSLWDGCDLP